MFTTDKRQTTFYVAHGTLHASLQKQLVVLTTEWLPWLQTSLRDGGLWKTNYIR